MNDVKKYYDSKSIIMALVIPKNCESSGVHFLTDNESFQQVAIMNHEKGHEIIPHYHNKIERVVDHTCETLIIKKGVLLVHLYEDKILRHTFKLFEGDIITLFSGGHGFEVIENVNMVEIKQGPFVGNQDKTRF